MPRSKTADLPALAKSIRDLQRELHAGFRDMGAKVRQAHDYVAPVRRRISNPNSETITASRNLTEKDDDLYCDCTRGDITLTLLEIADHRGLFFWIKKVDPSLNKVIIAAASGEKVETEASIELIRQGQSVTVFAHKTDFSDWNVK